MRLMSFDVSSVSTGWAYFNGNRLQKYDVITRSTIKDFSVAERLFIFKKSVEELLSKYKPEVVLIEQTYMKNVKTLKTLMQFIGVLQVACFELLGIESKFISPNTVRSYFGLKSKEDVYEFMCDKYKRFFYLYNFKSGNDISDAVVQGLYWIKSNKERNNE